MTALAQQPAAGDRARPRPEHTKPFVIEDPAETTPFRLPPPPELDLTPGGQAAILSLDQNQSLLGRSLDALPAPPAPAVVRAILGLVTVLVLAYLWGQPRVQEWERRLNIAHLITAGLPFLFLGFLASQPAVRILTPSVMREIAPLLPMGLGWVGFVIGSRFDARSLGRLAPQTGAAVLLTTCIPVAMILGTCGLLLLGAFPFLTGSGTSGALRDAVLLAIAGAMTARSAPHFVQAFSPGQQVSERLVRIIELEQLAGVFGMMMITAFFRPQGVTVAWQLPGTAWLFVTLGIGTTMGILIFATLARVSKGPQFTAALLGAVAFTAGMASFLRLSPVSVCFIAGAIVINLGGDWSEQIRELLETVERPIYFVFLVIAGALWHPWEWQGWILMAVFVGARFASKWISAVLLERFWMRDLAAAERRTIIGAPMGSLSLAIVVSAQDLFSGLTVGWIVTAVIGGAITMEVALQIAARRFASSKDAGSSVEAPGSTFEIG